ncbi:hypothetical protein, partial [Bacillus cereus group sp. BfR-BA-01441]|uniref:hypothetical protein n=1 Tax=Bacillus cereus group sp. BfR-BA-01441 TaxID=2920348 RepID=UPI0034D20DE6
MDLVFPEFLEDPLHPPGRLGLVDLAHLVFLEDQLGLYFLVVPEYLVFLEDQLDLLCHSDLVCLALLEDRLNHSDLGFLV